MLNFYVPPEERKDMVSRLIISTIIAATVTLFLSVSRLHALLDQAVYCFLIAILMWLFIDVGDCLVFNTALSESQLEPHMLYNTLANLRALVKTDQNLAIHMLDRIVDYMRATLGGFRASMHPMYAEFARIDDYLDLMKVRMGNLLNYSLHLALDLKNHPIPPFILQPLVENAIKHGIEPMVEGGKIFVKADIENDQIVLEVSDTGAGAHKDDLFKGNGFGWTQVTERLMTTYGRKSTINFIATEAYNTTVKITFPYVIQSIITK